MEDTGKPQEILDLFTTWENVVIVLGVGAAMELFKRGPLTRDFAKQRWGQALQYYAPVLWAWIFLFGPFGLANEDASTGSNLLLGVFLGSLTSSVYEWTVKAARRLFTQVTGGTTDVAPADAIVMTEPVEAVDPVVPAARPLPPAHEDE